MYISLVSSLKQEDSLILEECEGAEVKQMASLAIFFLIQLYFFKKYLKRYHLNNEGYA